jgi:hypothetical protein
VDGQAYLFSICDTGIPSQIYSRKYSTEQSKSYDVKTEQTPSKQHQAVMLLNFIPRYPFRISVGTLTTPLAGFRGFP